MKRRDDGEVAAWLEKGRRDLEMAARALAGPEALPDQACFHAQQAAEKVLKGVLVAHAFDVPRTHDLKLLLALLAERHDGLARFAPHVALLSQYAVEPRYPSFLAPETEDEARRALDLTRELTGAVLGLFPSDGAAGGCSTFLTCGRSASAPTDAGSTSNDSATTARSERTRSGS